MSLSPDRTGDGCRRQRRSAGQVYQLIRQYVRAGRGDVRESCEFSSTPLLFPNLDTFIIYETIDS